VFFGENFEGVFRKFRAKIEEKFYKKRYDFYPKFGEFSEKKFPEKTVSLHFWKIVGKNPRNFGGKIRGFFRDFRL